MSTTPMAPGNGLDLVAALLRLEQLVLQAETLAETRYLIVNETRSLAAFTQAALLTGTSDESLRLTALANLSEVDRTSPYGAWMERLARHCADTLPNTQASPLSPDQLNADLRREWADLAAPYLLWLPLFARENHRQGALVLGRDTPWPLQEQMLLGHLARIYAVALERFRSRRRWAWRQTRSRVLAGVTMLSLVALSFVPVRLSVLAPAEITPREAFVVTAPIDGVVNSVRVLPNQPITPGLVLVELETTDLKGMQEIAARALDVAQSELRRAQQAAFVDPQRKAELAQLQAQVDLKRREYQLASSRHQKALLRSDRSGVAVIDDPQAWQGRPVRVGERIMSIADPQQVEVTVMVPVKDAIVLAPGHALRLFLDTDPLNSLPATVQYVVYEASMTAEWPAYKVRARLDRPLDLPRIGLRGTARIYGAQTTLFFYLLRRPITAARQWLGW